MRVIVIGGSSGGGAAIAQRCASEGHGVVTMQRRPSEKMFQYEALDLRWPYRQVKEQLSAAVAIHGCDWLVIAGGVGAFTHPVLDGEKLHEIFQTNTLGPIAAFQGAYRGWLKERTKMQGLPGLSDDTRSRTLRVLYLGSSSERNPAKGIEVYAASKSAASKYFIEAGRRYARQGVRCNVLELGWFESPMIAELKPEIMAKIIKRIPANRVACPDEVADAAYAVLAGPDYFNGNRIEMSGGL